jgi:hypothetical protein
LAFVKAFHGADAGRENNLMAGFLVVVADVPIGDTRRPSH